jgi:hypothetical protein
MARLPIATRDSVPEAQRALFDELVQRMGAVPRYGPGSVMVHIPEAHRWATGLNDYLRNQSSLSKKVQELAMLVMPGRWTANISGTHMRHQRARQAYAMRLWMPCGTVKRSPNWRLTRQRSYTMVENFSAPIVSVLGPSRRRLSSLVARGSWS